MATSREEAIPLRSGEAADRVTGSGGHRVLSYQGGDPVLSGPSLDLSNHDDVPERRRVIRGIMRSVCVAGTMVRPLPPPSRRPPSAPLDPRLLVARRSTRLSATSDARHSDARPTRAHPLPLAPSLQAATAAALIVTVWTARTRTLQDSWRPVPGFDLDATFDAGDAPGGGWSASAASRAVAANLLAPAEPRLGEREESEESEENESRLGGFPFAPPKFYVYHDIYRAYEPVAKCARVGRSGGDLDSLGVASEIAFFDSLLSHPWRTVKPCEASVFVVPALPLAELRQKDGCAPANRSPERLRETVLATLGKSEHFAANAGRDHVLFSAETAPRTRNVPGAVPSLGLEKTARNVITAGPGLGLAGRTRDSSDRLTAPSASSRRVETMRGVTKNVDFVVVALDANEAEMHRLVRVARGRETTLVVTPARSAAAATTGRHLLAETEPWPAGQQRQYYAFREYPGSASAAREFGAEKARLGVKFAPRILTAEEREAAIRRAAKEVEKTSHAKHGKKASRETDAKEGAVAPVTTTSRLLPATSPGKWHPAPGLRDSSGSTTPSSGASGASRNLPAGTGSSAASRPAARVATRSNLPAGAWSSAARNDPRRFEAVAREVEMSTASRRAANGRGRALKASLGAAPDTDLRALDAPSRRAHHWWATTFAESASTLGERRVRASLPRPSEKVITSDEAGAFSRAKYCVVVTSRGMDDSVAAAAVANAVAAECVPVLVADAFPVAIPAVRWDSFVELVPRDAWAEDPARVLDLVTRKYRDFLEEGTPGWKKLDALRSAAPDLLWRHPESRVMDNLLVSVAKRSEEKFKTTTTGEKNTLAGCAKNEGGGAGARLAKLGASAPVRSKWARRAAMDEDASGARRANGKKIARIGMDSAAAEELDALYGDDISIDAPNAGNENDDSTVDAPNAPGMRTTTSPSTSRTRKRTDSTRCTATTSPSTRRTRGTRRMTSPSTRRTRKRTAQRQPSRKSRNPRSGGVRIRTRRARRSPRTIPAASCSTS